MEIGTRFLHERYFVYLNDKHTLQSMISQTKKVNTQTKICHGIIVDSENIMLFPDINLSDVLQSNKLTGALSSTIIICTRIAN